MQDQVFLIKYITCLQDKTLLAYNVFTMQLAQIKPTKLDFT